MRAFIVALGLTALLPFAALAQPKSAPPAPPAPPTQMMQMDGVKAGKVAAIGVGALLGVIAAEAVVVGDAAAIVGGVGGGIIGAWWYDSSGDTAKAPTKIKASVVREAAYRDEALRVGR